MNVISTDNARLIGVTMVAIGTVLLELKKPITRRYWERPHLGIRKRKIYGQQTLLREMAISDADSFFAILRLRPDSFDKLFLMVEPSITHYSPREPINPHTRLCVTIRYLATGETAKSLSYTYRLGISTTIKIIDETLSAIYNTLKPNYMPELTTEMLLESAKGFASRWSFPNCSGSCDGKHVRIRKPEKSGSLYYNYKNYHSVVMMAVCDYKYRFLAVDTGCQGSHNDSVVLNHSKIGGQLMTGTFNMPGVADIEFGPSLPHFLLGDGIFGNRPYLLTPYPGRSTGNLEYEQKIFNYRQSRGRRVIENTFGIYTATWRIFRTEINATPEIVDRIVLAAACLHNFRLSEQETLEPFDPSDQPENVSDEPSQGAEFDFELDPIASVSTDSAQSLNLGGNSIRDQLAEFFVSDGSVYWQDLMIN